ncbi:MAG: PDZ domain-containing protein, partial [Tepidiformaceae bacterium]
RDLGLPEGTRGILLPNGGNFLSVSNGGPAAAAGIQPGDVLTRIADVTLDNEGDLAIALIKNGPGESVEVELYRDGDKMTVQVTLGTPPA